MFWLSVYEDDLIEYPAISQRSKWVNYLSDIADRGLMTDNIKRTIFFHSRSHGVKFVFKFILYYYSIFSSIQDSAQYNSPFHYGPYLKKALFNCSGDDRKLVHDNVAHYTAASPWLHDHFTLALQSKPICSKLSYSLSSKFQIKLTEFMWFSSNSKGKFLDSCSKLEIITLCNRHVNAKGSKEDSVVSFIHPFIHSSTNPFIHSFIHYVASLGTGP